VEQGRVERRLAAILSADAVGYSRLMAEDEVATVHTLTSYRGQIEALVRDHRGRVVDSPGDNLLAEFPAATDAARCAVDIQRVINVAARLEGLAEPGGVCASAALRHQVARKLDLVFQDLGEQEIKNIPEPVRTFRIDLEGVEKTRPSKRRQRGVWIATASIAVAAALVALGLLLRQGPIDGGGLPSGPVRFTLDLPAENELHDTSFPPVAISPEGRSIVYVVGAGDSSGRSRRRAGRPS
jgi:hypothetical protein